MAEGGISKDASSWEALTHAFVMIVVSEIGDKTFLIAAIMATRHPRLTVFGGAFGSLVVMSILSAAMGRVILGLVPKVYTQYAAAVLFLIFGIKILREAIKMPSGTSHIQEEMREVEEEIEEDDGLRDGTAGLRNGHVIPLESLEEGSFSSFGPSTAYPRPSSPSSSKARSPSISVGRRRNSLSMKSSGNSKSADLKQSIRNALQLVTSPVFAQAFVLTFLGEWGDRSQIATIALGGAHSVAVIAFGTILGHGLCTAGAVIGGRYLSTKISVKHISLIGACAFFVFAFLYFYEAWTSPAEAVLAGVKA